MALSNFAGSIDLRVEAVIISQLAPADETIELGIPVQVVSKLNVQVVTRM